jgi:hypothetical protein
MQLRELMILSMRRESLEDTLSTLPPIPSPPIYNLPSLSDTDDDNVDD